MSYTVANGVRDAAVNAVTALFNGGSAAAGGAIIFRNATTTIATCLMNNPAFGNASGGNPAAMDTTGVIDGTVVPAGSSTIDRFRGVNRDGTTLLDGAAGSVATSGADINLSSVIVNQNDVIEITGLSISLPATAGV